MANPTTNYGFVLPTPTDLVTDLPADFEVALQGVDTQMKTNADAAIPKTIVDAKGDLIAGTAADTVARIGVGANNTVLTADSSTATGMKWEVVSAGATINYQAFTSSTTWTVPATAKYVDVLVVGGGTGGTGGSRSTNASGSAGNGGGITLFNNIFLNGTGTVSIVVGAGSNGTTGTSTTSSAADPSSAGFSGFGTFCYSQGAIGTGGNGMPAYKGTQNGYTSRVLSNDSNQSNYAPITVFSSDTTYSFYNGTVTDPQMFIGLNAFGFAGGRSGRSSSNASPGYRSGTPAGLGQPPNQAGEFTTMTLPSPISSEYNAAIGAATAGTDGQGRSGTGGAAGIAGFAGGGGTCVPSTSQPGAQGGHGAGGGGSWPASTGLNGGNGGNAGTNTGAGGGAGATTGSTSAGTGGTGGNGAAGIVIVKWIS
jgi:hypothetical protein